VIEFRKIRKVDPNLEVDWMLVLYRKPCHRRSKPRAEIDGVRVNKNTGAYMGTIRRLSKVILDDNEKVQILITAFDEQNYETTFENPVLVSSDTSALTIEIDSEGKIWAVSGAPGLNARVTGEIDAKMGEGVVPIPIEPIDFTIKAGQAVRAATTLGTPIPK
jgi:hypothetical protein